MSRLDWGRVRCDFHCVWAHRVPQFSSGLFSVGEIVFEGENLQAFRAGRSGDGEKGMRQSPIL
jgi:hypothetical protein